VITKERRFSDRYPGAGLKFELQSRYWFGLKKEKQTALVTDFSTGGAAITTPLKLKVGQRVQVAILSEYHNIRQLPAEIVRCNGKSTDYHYSICFHFGKLPKVASNNMVLILRQIERSLRKSLNTG
jgi:hypothetical protein